ncbi:beta-lactamase family protein [Microbacteriaceae bacterium VKM Ac-2855]|nr:beta-lactamase family protein [Microbacteriaceae bacterium VKM Ac-2855]
MLSRSTPSAHRIDAAGIRAFVDALESAADIEPHSLMLLRDGEIVAESWWAPYSAERPHLLYSLSKSFTSTAVGFAVAEGLLDLDDTVISHFPELDAEITDPRTRAMKLRHILAMASGHREETIDRARANDPVDLVRGFLLIRPDAEPGTLFAYNQPCTFTAAAIVQRVTGLSLTEYLRPRLLDPLGIDRFGWLRDESGREFGYSGLHARTEAIAALGQLYLQRGEWQGRQLLPAGWVDDATRSHVANGTDPDSDWAQGYGFQFWIARHGYRGDGAYGQFCVVLPEHGVVLAITGQSLNMQGVLDLAWTHLLPAIDVAGDAAADTSLAEQLADRALVPVRDDGNALPIGQFRAAAGNDVPTLVRLEVSPDGGVVLIEGVDALGFTPGRGTWQVTEAIAASAGTAPGGATVDVIFVETPHRLRLVLDPVTATFSARWLTRPLHPQPLAETRSPERWA